MRVGHVRKVKNFSRECGASDARMGVAYMRGNSGGLSDT